MKTSERDQRKVNRSGQGAALGFVIGMLFGGLVDIITGDRGTATIIGMLLGSLIGYLGPQRVQLMEYPPGVVRNLVVSGVLFLLAVAGSVYLVAGDISRSMRLAVVIAPALTGMLFLLALADAISKLDELQRRIQTESIAIGFGLTALITLVYGLLGLMGLQQPNMIYVTPIMIFSWLAGKLWLRWKYR